MSKYFKILLILFFILGIFTLKDYFTRKDNTSQNPLQINGNETQSSLYKNAQIVFSNSVIEAEIADTPNEKELGLSFRDSLDNDKGMLFVFDEPVVAFFWMKDMRIPLDIIWISDNKVVDIDMEIPIPKSDTPLIQLPKYSPVEKVNYVLEVNAGFSKTNNIKVGDTVTISL